MAALAAQGRGDEQDLLPAGAAEAPLAIDDRAAGETARRQEQIEQPPEEGAPAGLQGTGSDLDADGEPLPLVAGAAAILASKP